MRLSGIDHLRGFGVVLVFIFSLWYFMYSESQPDFQLLAHNISGEFRAGDLVFSLFLFCSGVSLWFYFCKLRASGGAIADGWRKYLALLLFAVFLAAIRLLIHFPDEVMLIALCDIIALNALWHFKRQHIFAYAFAVSLSLLLLQAFASDFWAAQLSSYMGGWLSLPYYSLITLFGALAAQDAFSKGALNLKTSLAALWKWLTIWFVITLVCAAIWPIDKNGLSLSFIAVSNAICLLLLIAFVWLCDIRKWKNDFLSVLGANSLWGWALLYVLTMAILFSGYKGAFYAEAYFPACLFILLFLYAALKLIKKEK